MEPIEIVAQVIGLVAMAMNVLSYQQKSQKGVIGCQLLGSALFTVNFLLLGATMGAVLNGLGIVRALVYMHKERTKAHKLAWVFAFSAAFILSYVLTFTLFGKEPGTVNLIVEILPVIAMIATTISFRCKGAAAIRMFGIVSSPLWLTYNIINFSVGAICCEVLNLISILIGIIRFDISKGGKKDA